MSASSAVRQVTLLASAEWTAVGHVTGAAGVHLVGVAAVVVLLEARATTVANPVICLASALRNVPALARLAPAAAVVGVAVEPATTVARRVTCRGTAVSSAGNPVVVVAVVDALTTGSATTVETAVTCQESVLMVEDPPAATRSATSAVAQIIFSVTVPRAAPAVAVDSATQLAATTATSSVTSPETVQWLHKVYSAIVYIGCSVLECTTVYRVQLYIDVRSFSTRIIELFNVVCKQSLHYLSLCCLR